MIIANRFCLKALGIASEILAQDLTAAMNQEEHHV
jgi:hypothetical protein